MLLYVAANLTFQCSGGASSLQPKVYIGFNIGSGCKLDVLAAAANLTPIPETLPRKLYLVMNDGLRLFKVLLAY